jgi:hypothetical protein
VDHVGRRHREPDRLAGASSSPALAGTPGFAWDTTMEEFRRVTEVTYYGQVHGTVAALELTRPRNSG